MKAELLLASHVTHANLRSLQASRLSAIMSTMFNYAPRLAALSTIKPYVIAAFHAPAYMLSGVAKKREAYCFFITFYNGLLHSGSPRLNHSIVIQNNTMKITTATQDSTA